MQLATSLVLGVFLLSGFNIENSISVAFTENCPSCEISKSIYYNGEKIKDHPAKRDVFYPQQYSFGSLENAENPISSSSYENSAVKDTRLQITSSDDHSSANDEEARFFLSRNVRPEFNQFSTESASVSPEGRLQQQFQQEIADKGLREQQLLRFRSAQPGDRYSGPNPTYLNSPVRRPIIYQQGEGLLQNSRRNVKIIATEPPPVYSTIGTPLNQYSSIPEQQFQPYSTTAIPLNRYSSISQHSIQPSAYSTIQTPLNRYSSTPAPVRHTTLLNKILTTRGSSKRRNNNFSHENNNVSFRENNNLLTSTESFSNYPSIEPSTLPLTHQNENLGTNPDKFPDTVPGDSIKLRKNLLGAIPNYNSVTTLGDRSSYPTLGQQELVNPTSEKSYIRFNNVPKMSLYDEISAVKNLPTKSIYTSNNLPGAFNYHQYGSAIKNIPKISIYDQISTVKPEWENFNNSFYSNPMDMHFLNNYDDYKNFEIDNYFRNLNSNFSYDLNEMNNSVSFIAPQYGLYDPTNLPNFQISNDTNLQNLLENTEDFFVQNILDNTSTINPKPIDFNNYNVDDKSKEIKSSLVYRTPVGKRATDSANNNVEASQQPGILGEGGKTALRILGTLISLTNKRRRRRPSTIANLVKFG